MSIQIPEAQRIQNTMNWKKCTPRCIIVIVKRQKENFEGRKKKSNFSHTREALQKTINGLFKIL